MYPQNKTEVSRSKPSEVGARTGQTETSHTQRH